MGGFASSSSAIFPLLLLLEGACGVEMGASSGGGRVSISTTMISGGAASVCLVGAGRAVDGYDVAHLVHGFLIVATERPAADTERLVVGLIGASLRGPKKLLHLFLSSHGME